MIKKINGKVTSIFGDDINTDDIIPAWTLQESTERGFFAQYAFEKYDADFVNRCKQTEQNIVIAGKNFACGSSREQAVYALQGNNVVAVIAESYPDIFYRNSLNNGLVLITLPDTSIFNINDEIIIDLENKTITINNHHTINFEMDERDRTIFMQGGVIGRIRNDVEAKIKGETKSQSHYTEMSINFSKPKTIAEKIISDHLGYEVNPGDKIERLPIDILFFNEVIAPPAITEFINNFSDIYKKYNQSLKVFDHEKIFLIPDHTVPSSSVAVSEGIDLMERFAS